MTVTRFGGWKRPQASSSSATDETDDDTPLLLGPDVPEDEIFDEEDDLGDPLFPPPPEKPTAKRRKEEKQRKMDGFTPILGWNPVTYQARFTHTLGHIMETVVWTFCPTSLEGSIAGKVSGLSGLPP